MTEEVLPSYTFRVETPDGTMYCIVVEKDDKPYRMEINVGKTGAPIRAWTFALASIISLALKHGINAADIATELSETLSDRAIKLENGVTLRSGPEGVVYCLLKYVQQKKKESGRAKYDTSGPYSDA